jgi:hypothetical protein
MDTTVTPSSKNAAPTYIERTDPAERQQHGDTSHIPGWGADLARENRPAVPKERTPARLPTLHWDAPSPQEAKVKIYHSVERPGITPVFGTSTPPSGLSGKMRDVAYKYSENDIRHWLMLLGADRVNVVEGLLDDLAHGHVPNFFAEMGGPAEWKYNRQGFIKKALIVGALVGTVVYLRRRRRD